jgi:hypothetical protein
MVPSMWRGPTKRSTASWALACSRVVRSGVSATKPAENDDSGACVTVRPKDTSATKAPHWAVARASSAPSSPVLTVVVVALTGRVALPTRSKRVGAL